jgi:dTDP-glucose pyrophosphorylase
MNMWGFTPQIFGQLRELFQSFLELNSSSLQAEFYITSAVNELLMSGQARVMVLQTRDSWFGVTYREDHPHVVENLGRLIQDGCYPKRLWP